MGRGVSAGGGQSSLGYLFGDGKTTSAPSADLNPGKGQSNEPPPKPAAASPPAEQVPAGGSNRNVNNYYRADGQNCGNFITERPSTKVHAAPGGGSSLGYLFGGGSN